MYVVLRDLSRYNRVKTDAFNMNARGSLWVRLDFRPQIGLSGVSFLQYRQRDVLQA